MMEFSKENITTIATFLYVIVAPVMVKYFNFNIDESTFVAVIGFIIAFVSAKHPNTFLGNAPVNDYEVGDDDGC